MEDRWRQAATAAGKGADLEAIRAIAPDLVDVKTGLVTTVVDAKAFRQPA